jgi:hypothetical protein
MSRFYLKTETESSLRNAGFLKNRRIFFDKDKINTGRWIMSNNKIFLLMYHSHKLSDLIYIDQSGDVQLQ